ncbi:M15 family metallopeptidase [Clostridium gasigenes]|uniref:M15 family metallopeptidase n=1 Tax=Clostridium gasigenes TaxID=94869 RepID=UPI001FAB415A|nr:M15 family metallopeptidase [Clostridium gasigenes]
MNKKKNQKINIKRIKRIRRIKKSIITMVLFGVVLGLMVYIPINIKKKALIARDVVASEKFKDDINVLGTFNRLREDNKSIYASDEVSIKINSEIEEILEELKNGVTDKVKELVDNLNSLLVDVSAGNHSELEQLFNKLNEDKMTGFTQEEVKKVNTLMDEYNLLIKEQKYSEAKVDLEDINTYVKEVKKIVETRITKEEYDKKSTEDEKSRKATYINGILLVNKKNGLPDSFGDAEDPKAREAFEEMKKAAGKDGLYINAFSTYRSFWTQNRLYWNYVASFGQEPTDTFSARAGFSEHQTGLGFDVGGADRSLWANQEFQYTAEAEWLKNNCYKYGFILRYPEGKEWKTGFVYESWHFRYLGEEHSKNFNNNNLTLEEYLGV